ncbi:hypothetical protein AGR1C_pAt20132 [Agrobacterium fabacearum TT111]|nr:hypothetical protein AGR1C_pAt20132 [Agrobacterium fabacearum TT111]
MGEELGRSLQKANLRGTDNAAANMLTGKSGQQALWIGWQRHAQWRHRLFLPLSDKQ